MIPYDQLVSALTSWRQRNGLPTLSSELGGGAASPMPIDDAPLAYGGGGGYQAADDESFPSEHTALSSPAGEVGEAIDPDAEPIEEIDDEPRH